MNLTCWFFERELSARIMRGETAPDSDSPLGRHLSVCTHCRQVSLELSQIHKTLPTMATPAVHLDFEEQVLKKLQSATISLVPRAARGRKLWVLAPNALRGTLGAVALIACGGLILWLNKPAHQGEHQFQEANKSVHQAGLQYGKPTVLVHQQVHQYNKAVALVHQGEHQFQKTNKSVHQVGLQYHKAVVLLHQQVHQYDKPTVLVHQVGHQFQETNKSVYQQVHQYDKAVVTPKQAVLQNLKHPTDDIVYLNGDGFDGYARRASALLKLDPNPILKTLPESTRGDDFILVPLPQLATTSKSAMAEALSHYEQEKQIVDARLQHKVTLGFKRVSFSELCEKLSKETGIETVASRSVSDEKLTLFCKDRPVRDLMRQITKLFGFVWERNGTEDSFRYKLTEPLKVRILEEELRNRDRNEALLALDREMDAYKNLLGLSPEDARAQAESLPDGPAKERLKKLGGMGWGPTQLYQGLSSEERDTLLSGGRIDFGGKSVVPENFKKGVLDSLKGHAYVHDGGGLSFYGDRDSNDAKAEKGKAPSEVPGVEPVAALELERSELGEYHLNGWSGFLSGGGAGSSSASLAKGISPSATSPENAKVNADKKALPTFQKPVAPGDELGASKSGDAKKKLTTADVLEAFHKATGRDVIGDYFTRLYDPQKLFGKGKTPTFDALNRACDATRLRWDDKDGFLTFRSTDFFNMRLKEVPNRLLDRWAAARKEKKALTESELREISRLSDFQLDASGMTEGAKILWSLDEWDEVRSTNLRPIWRFLDTLPAPQRLRMLTDGLGFGGLGLEAQQKFLGLLYYPGDKVRRSLEDGSADDALLKRLAKASLQLTDDPARLPKELGNSQNGGRWSLISRAPQGESQIQLKVTSQNSMSSTTTPGQ